MSNCSKDPKNMELDFSSVIICDRVYHKENNILTYKGHIVFNVVNTTDRDIIINDVDSEYSLNYSDVQTKSFLNKDKFKVIRVGSGKNREFSFPVGGKMTLPINHSVTVKFLIDHEWKKIEVPINDIIKTKREDR